jgi:hypothetical protein
MIAFDLEYFMFMCNYVLLYFIMSMLNFCFTLFILMNTILGTAVSVFYIMHFQPSLHCLYLKPTLFIILNIVRLLPLNPHIFSFSQPVSLLFQNIYI